MPQLIRNVANALAAFCGCAEGSVLAWHVAWTFRYCPRTASFPASEHRARRVIADDLGVDVILRVAEGVANLAFLVIV